MFKKIQKYLLLNHPLLWNTKAAVASVFLISFHVIFFLIGYVNGRLDFTETGNRYSSNDQVVIFFSILISVLFIIIWLVYYFKNNAFKAYYPKTNLSLFKEWCLLFFICFMACSFTMSYSWGSDVRVRGYYSENEARKRCETLSKASIFYGDRYDLGLEIDSIKNDTVPPTRLDYVEFKGKQYSLKSLINKDIVSYSFFDAKWDSVTKVKVKTWLVNNNQDSVKNVMNNYFLLIKEHNLKTNIDPKKWFELVYTAPEFEQTRVIAKREMDFYNDGNYDYDYDYEYDDYATTVTAVPYDGELKGVDTLNEYVKLIDKEKYVFFKTYLPASQLEYNYQKIAESYISPALSLDMFLAMLYLSVGLSLAIYSFKVTSGKNWLIALISLGVLNILFGITSIMITENIYLFCLLGTTLLLLFYFILVVKRQTTKGISGITLNGLLWLTPAFLPVLHTLLVDLLRYYYGYYDYNSEGFQYENYPLLKFLKNNDEEMLWVNLLLIVIMMLFYSFQIKKWKALAES